MDPRITDLKSTTFSGRRLTRRQIADIQKTVVLFPNHSRNELAKTLCEHLNWVSAKGDYRVGACMKLLETLERHGILTLPPKREAQVRDMTPGPVWTSASDRRPALCADLSDLRPLRLEPVTDTDRRQLWNAFVDRHHYLGYRRPFGAHIRYFVADREGRKLGCLLFEAATKTLPCRDNWIGWSDRARGRSRRRCPPTSLPSNADTAATGFGNGALSGRAGGFDTAIPHGAVLAVSQPGAGPLPPRVAVPRAGGHPWGAFERVPSGRTDRPASSEAIRGGAPPAGQHSCHARAALQRGTRRAHPGPSHAGEEHLALRPLQVASHDPAGGRGAARHPGFADIGTIPVLGARPAPTRLDREMKTLLLARAVGYGARVSVLPGAKPVPLLQQRQYSLRQAPGPPACPDAVLPSGSEPDYSGYGPDTGHSGNQTHPASAHRECPHPCKPAPAFVPLFERTGDNRQHKVEGPPSRVRFRPAQPHTLGCPRFRRIPRQEPSSSDVRHGRNMGCRAGSHPPGMAHRPRQPPGSPPACGLSTTCC